MKMPIISTKLSIPPIRSKIVARPRLLEQLNEGMHHKLTIISAGAGFGKTTLVSQWLTSCEQPVTWLSLEEGDNDLARFLTYLFVALRKIEANIGEGVIGLLQSSQLPPIDSILGSLINDVSSVQSDFILVLDDYHMIDAHPIGHAIEFLLDHMPPQMHLVLTTREEPRLSIARLRARGQLTEVRTVDLRFTSYEAAEFLNRVMGLNLSAEEIALLESRTEGWIAGLQLAALSMQDHKDVSDFIQSFTGSHHFVLDYLVEEVLQQQPKYIQAFLLHTSILERLCGPLCDAVLGRKDEERITSPGQEVLERLENANLFIIALDNERRWYRYHHLFVDVLRRLRHSSIADEKRSMAQLHILASIWYEDNCFELEAFHHAVAANDVNRAAHLIEGGEIPLLFSGAVTPVQRWLDSLPMKELDVRPSLWVMYASALLSVGQMAGVEQKLVFAENALQGVEQDDKTLDLIGHIASIRATLAVSKHQTETILDESRRALEYLHPDNLPVRTATTWTMGYAYQLQGDRAAARKAYIEALSISQNIGHVIITIMTTLGLGSIHEGDNQLYEAAETYRHALKLAGDPAMPVACEAHLGLARIYYEWNDLDNAEKHGQRAVQLARQFENTDRSVASEVFLARLKFVQGNDTSAMAILDKAEQLAWIHNFTYQIPEIVATRIQILLRQGQLDRSAQLVTKYEHSISQTRVHLAQGNAFSALTILESLLQQAEEKGWNDERMKLMALQALAYRAKGERDKAIQVLGEILAMAKPGGYIRMFIDEGLSMESLLTEGAIQGMMPDYTQKLKLAFEMERKIRQGGDTPNHPLIEPLSERELQVLQLIAEGHSNLDISKILFLALDTVKGHNRRIYGKLQVQRRTEAVARAREYGLL
ncbi:tetratricopeptide repeat protein [Halalkalibacter sp. APA_J-10(15)]|uniref:LuxR C-terminal-related transcriptional regulator n=1 Tax=Halalkalibacter sp. APA_J-10(15) TaxID=2933805 RepID=UPI001FF30B4E|nr:tetratricopeptide repeat protein [Halalkalibacter sp. APA_J-10(15)]MCK0469849.1 LuxR C-terminal-related transcriptional regulator [Halalkalibacter sp. APA_J-10(15)]